MSSSLTTDSSGSDFGLLGNRKSLPKKPVKSFIVPKMRRMFEKSKSAEPETLSQMDRPLSSSPGRKIKINIQQSKDDGCRGDGTESVSSFVIVTTANDGDRLSAAPREPEPDSGPKDESLLVPVSTIDPESTSASEWSYTGDDGDSGGGGVLNGANTEDAHKGFVNRCVSKVKNLVKQGSPPQT